MRCINTCSAHPTPESEYPVQPDGVLDDAAEVGGLRQAHVVGGHQHHALLQLVRPTTTKACRAAQQRAYVRHASPCGPVRPSDSRLWKASGAFPSAFFPLTSRELPQQQRAVRPPGRARHRWHQPSTSNHRLRPSGRVAAQPSPRRRHSEW